MLSMDSFNSGQFSKEMRKIKTKLKVIDEEMYRGAVIRGHSDRLWLRETPNKWELSDENKHAVSKEIKKICYHSEVTSDSKTIELAFVEY